MGYIVVPVSLPITAIQGYLVVAELGSMHDENRFRGNKE